MKDLRFAEGTKYHIDAYSDELWLKDYHVRVCCTATVVETPDTKAKKVLVKLDEVDGDHDVICRVNKRYLYDKAVERM